jgi:hypothetical protein
MKNARKPFNIGSIPVFVVESFLDTAQTAARAVIKDFNFRKEGQVSDIMAVSSILITTFLKSA